MDALLFFDDLPSDMVYEILVRCEPNALGVLSSVSKGARESVLAFLNRGLSVNVYPRDNVFQWQGQYTHGWIEKWAHIQVPDGKSSAFAHPSIFGGRDTGYGPNKTEGVNWHGSITSFVNNQTFFRSMADLDAYLASTAVEAPPLYLNAVERTTLRSEGESYFAIKPNGSIAANYHDSAESFGSCYVYVYYIDNLPGVFDELSRVDILAKQRLTPVVKN
jgi:hypothetical protein